MEGFGDHPEGTHPPHSNGIVSQLYEVSNDDAMVSFQDFDGSFVNNFTAKISVDQNFGQFVASDLAVTEETNSANQGNSLPFASEGHTDPQDSLISSQTDAGQNILEASTTTQDGGLSSFNRDLIYTVLYPLPNPEEKSQISNELNSENTFVLDGDPTSTEWANTLASFNLGDVSQEAIINTDEDVGTNGGGISTTLVTPDADQNVITALNVNGCNTTCIASTSGGINGNGTGVADMSASGTASEYIVYYMGVQGNPENSAISSNSSVPIIINTPAGLNTSYGIYTDILKTTEANGGNSASNAGTGGGIIGTGTVVTNASDKASEQIIQLSAQVNPVNFGIANTSSVQLSTSTASDIKGTSNSQCCYLGPKKTGRKRKSGEVPLHTLNTDDYKGDDRTRVRKAKNAYNRRVRLMATIEKQKQEIVKLQNKLAGHQ